MQTTHATIINKHPTKSGSFVYHLVDENRHAHRAFSTKEHYIDDEVLIIELNFRTYIVEKEGYI